MLHITVTYVHDKSTIVNSITLAKFKVGKRIPILLKNELLYLTITETQLE